MNPRIQGRPLVKHSAELEECGAPCPTGFFLGDARSG